MPFNSIIMIEKLLDIVAELQIKIDELQKRVDELTVENEMLRQQLKDKSTKRNSGNSHMPPSNDMAKPKNKNTRRTPSGKKPGGQKGHKGHTLSEVADPAHTIKHFPEGACPKCGLPISQGQCSLAFSRQVCDIPPIKPEFTEHKVYAHNCHCGQCTLATVPPGVSAPVQYGNRIRSLVAYLNIRQYIPYRRIQEMLRGVFNIHLSEGTIGNILKGSGDGLIPVYESIKAELESARVVGSDETSLKVNGEKHWGWTWQNNGCTYISISPTRGYAAVKALFPDGFPNATLVSDSLAAQLKTPAKQHQLCLSHLDRDLDLLIELYPFTWPDRMKSLLRDAVRLKRSMAPGRYDPMNGQVLEMEKKMTGLLSEDIPVDYPKAETLKKRLVKNRDNIFTFLYEPSVPPDNNSSERAVRNFKVKQKVSGQFRSSHGANSFAIIRSVIDTFIKKGADVLGTMEFALKISTQTKAYTS